MSCNEPEFGYGEYLPGLEVRAPAFMLGQAGLKTFDRLRKADGGEIWVIGTAHAGIEGTADAIRDIICKLRPDVVALELCPQRAHAMLTPLGVRWEVPAELQGAPVAVPRPSQVAPLASVTLINAALAAAADGGYADDQVVPAKVAKECGARVFVVDRPLTTTLARTTPVCFTLPRVWVGAAAVALLTDSRTLLAWAMHRVATSEIEACRPHVPAPLTRASEEHARVLWRALGERRATPEDVDLLVRTMPLYAQASALAFRRGKVGAEMLTATLTERDTLLARALSQLPGDVAVAFVGAAHVDGISAQWAAAADPGAADAARSLLRVPWLQTATAVAEAATLLLGPLVGCFCAARVLGGLPRGRSLAVAGAAAAAMSAAAMRMAAVLRRRAAELGATISHARKAPHACSP